MAHDTSFDVICLMQDIRHFLYGIAGTNPSEQVKLKAKHLIDRIDDAIGEEV